MKWISVKDRLPEFQETVWIWYANKEWTYGHLYSIEEDRYGKKLKWYDSRAKSPHLQNATHWMPLPEPPKHQ